MENKLERLKALADKAEAIATYELTRKRNLKRLKTLFDELELGEKTGGFDKIFDYRAINLSGIGLTEKNLGKITPKRYAQIIAIVPSDEEGGTKNRNISLGYYGRTERLDEGLKERIVEFILRWRLEKSFRNVDHYRDLLKNLES